MRFISTPLTGAYLIELEPHQDERGFFARTFCQKTFTEYGLNADFIQQSTSWNPKPGTLRGLHYQAEPHAEDKLVRVSRGAIFDVIVDLRANSVTYGQWFGVELTASNYLQLYIPKGFAHGFQTLEPETEVSYHISVAFEPSASRGIRWNDPQLAIAWPKTPKDLLMSPRDRHLPFLSELNTFESP